MNAIHPHEVHRELAVTIPAGPTELEGVLSVPPRARGVVVFAHGSGSGRYSPRNKIVAGHLQAGQLATLLIDLLDDEEAQDRDRVFDVELQARRLDLAAAWAATEPTLRGLPLGYFGASTGAGAALLAAAEHPGRVAAVVSRGGRPDLAAGVLPRVDVPTLLIVGSHDPEVLALNRLALDRLGCPKQLAVIPGASHLFPEPGVLDEVARLATLWFHLHLKHPVSPATAPAR